MGKILSDWLGHSSYHSTTTLTLRCRNCRKLPSLGQLPTPKHLEISYFDKLTSIGAEFYKNDGFCHETPFPSLETLVFDTMSSWQAWHSSQFDAAFSQLKRLSISSCPMLTGDLPSHLPALEELRINGCKLLDCSLPSAPDILKLRVHGVSEVRFKDPPLSLCSESASGSKHMESALEKLVRCLASSTVLHCCSLISLEISSACDSVKSFPREGCLPASLERLHVEHFPSLDTLDCKGLLHLTSLQKLVIEDCPKLESIVGENLPAALTHLYIGYSPLFGDRCQGRDPQIWPKISHIADIRVDLRRICDPGSSTDTDINVNYTDSDTEGRMGQNSCCKGYFKCFRM